MDEESEESEKGEPGEMVHLTKARPKGPQRRPQSAVGEFKIEVLPFPSILFVINLYKGE